MLHYIVLGGSWGSRNLNCFHVAQLERCFDVSLLLCCSLGSLFQIIGTTHAKSDDPFWSVYRDLVSDVLIRRAQYVTS